MVKLDYYRLFWKSGKRRVVDTSHSKQILREKAKALPKGKYYYRIARTEHGKWALVVKTRSEHELSMTKERMNKRIKRGQFQHSLSSVPVELGNKYNIPVKSTNRFGDFNKLAQKSIQEKIFLVDFETFKKIQPFVFGKYKIYYKPITTEERMIYGEIIDAAIAGTYEGQHVIRIYDDFFDLPIQERKKKFAHEMGHLWENELKEKKKNAEKIERSDIFDSNRLRKAMNLPHADYGVTVTPDEIMAETFSWYVMQPRKLRRNFPQVYKFIKATLRGHSVDIAIKVAKDVRY